VIWFAEIKVSFWNMNSGALATPFPLVSVAWPLNVCWTEACPVSTVRETLPLGVIVIAVIGGGELEPTVIGMLAEDTEPLEFPVEMWYTPDVVAAGTA
jgi:hypothetical protein